MTTRYPPPFFQQNTELNQYNNQTPTSLTATPAFTLQSLRFTGDGIDPQTLTALTQNDIGKTVTLVDLQAITARISDYYRHAGYPAATAFLPPQNADDGSIEVRVLLGRLGQVTVDNRSHLRPAMAQAAAARLTAALPTGETLRSDAVLPQLERLNRIPGIAATGNLSAGTAVGDSDLTVQLTDSHRLTAAVYADNYGGRFSGQYRLGTILNGNNLAGIGDQLTISALATNHRLYNGSLGYDIPIGTGGSRAGISYSHLHYNLSGNAFDQLDAVGVADTVSLYGNTPVLDSAHSHTAVTYGYKYRRLNDELRQFNIQNRKHSHAGTLGINGDWLGGSGDNHHRVQYHFDYTLGNLRAHDHPSPAAGSFHKLNLNAAYTYARPTWQLYGGIQAQLANRNLDGSEQFYLGGADGVRAYAQGESGGDSGYQATVEYRYLPPKIQGLTLKTYLDWGRVDNKLSGTHRSLAAWGIGVAYHYRDSWQIRADYAHKINGKTDTADDHNRNGRFWLQAVKHF